MRIRRGFTLVELLIAMIITGLVMSAVMTLFFSVFKSYEFHQDISSAKQRGYMALAVIQPLVLNAGLGLPPDGNPFDSQNLHRAFDPGLGDLPPLFPPGVQEKRFSSFVQLANDNDTRLSSGVEAPALWLVYAVPSGIGTDNGDNVKWSDPTGFNMQINAALPPQNITPGNRTSLKSWCLFSSVQTPLEIQSMALSDGVWRIGGKIYNDAQILPFDELYYLRAAKVSVENSRLTVDHLDGSGKQSVVDGIIGIWCEFDRSTRLLTIRVLARADLVREPGVQGELDGWPAVANARWPRNEAYRHAVVARSWRIRN